MAWLGQIDDADVPSVSALAVKPPRPISSVAALISSARSAISSIAASSKSRVTAFGWGQRFFA